MKRTKNDYIFEHPQSRNLYVRLRGTDGKRHVQSLHTSDYREAEVAAGELITAHKARLLAARPRFETSRWYEYEPGRQHTGPDGLPIIATTESLIFLDANGAIRETTPNGGVQYRHPTRLKEPSWELFDRERAAAPSKKSGDDAIIDTYIKHAALKESYAREARAVWALFQSLCDKPLKDASRDDGRKLVAHFDAQGLKSATMHKKIGWLTAAVNLAIDEGRLKFNPFSSIVPKRDDKARRLPLDDADMTAIKANLDRLDERNQLLLRILACTGMRLSEALSIKEEMIEGGCRFVVVGTKTEQSLRRVPLPHDVLPFLPETIKGPLFAGTALAASKRFSVFLDRCGIVDPNKTTHSLRHRAQDKLRAAECPQDIREALLGHSKVTVGEGYGLGFSVPVLRKWIDKIGF